jgi:hypothetical protein
MRSGGRGHFWAYFFIHKWFFAASMAYLLLKGGVADAATGH